MKRITARYPGTCVACNGSIEAGETVDWSPKTKSIAHADVSCVTADARRFGSAAADPSGEAGLAESECSEGSAWGHGPGCQGECDGEYDCHSPGRERLY